LQTQELLFCFPFSGCQYNHPLVLPLLQQYLPAPSGMDEAVFYADLPTHTALIDTTKWDAAQFAADFKARIIDPGRHARDLLAKWPYLTRLFTTISPAEMTLDPVFVARPDLSAETVGGLAQFATQRITCSGEQGMILPDSREVALQATSSWPIFSSLMPWAERIQEVPASGPVITLVDNTDKIDEQLALWNEAQGWTPGGAAAGQGGATGGVGGGAAAGGTTNASGGADASGVSAGGGCGCAVPGGNPAHGAWAIALAGLAVAARRRRRQ
jgi:MYXO-CTERM domain-containing protein